VAADSQNSKSIPSNLKTGRVSDASISAMGNLCGILKLFRLSTKLKSTFAFFGQIKAPSIRKTISLDTLFRIAKALDVPPYKFLILD